MSFHCDLVRSRERVRRAPVVGTAHNFFVEPFQRVGVVQFCCGAILSHSKEPRKATSPRTRRQQRTLACIVSGKAARPEPTAGVMLTPRGASGLGGLI